MAPASTKWLGIGTVIHGAFFIYVSDVTLPAALRVADILYAEDFDRSGVVPAWFGPWHFATRHAAVAMLVYLMSGLALVMAGALFIMRGLGARRLLERTLPTATVLCWLLAVALIPLSSMVSGWPSGTPGYDLRRTLIAGTTAAWLECLLLLATIVIVKRMRTPLASGTMRAERATWRTE
jgi:hypothetical protein